MGGGTWDAAGSTGLEGPLPLLPPHAAHDGRDSRIRLLSTCRCCSRRRSGLVPLYGAATGLLALSPLSTGAINARKEGWAGGCWCCVDDVTRCCRRQSVVRRRRPLARCRQCVKARPDEMSGRNEMKPAAADEEEEKKKIRQQQQGQGPGWWLHAIRPKARELRASLW